MRVPSLARFGLNMRKPRAGRRVWNSYKMLAGRALNLQLGELGLAFQRLVAMRTLKFEFMGAHNLHPHHAQSPGKKYMPDWSL